MLVLGIRVPAGKPHKHIPRPESCLTGCTQVILSENRGSSCSKGPQPPSTQLPGPGPWPSRALSMGMDKGLQSYRLTCPINNGAGK